MTSAVDQIPGPSPEDRERIRASLFQVGAGKWGFDNPEILEVWLVEQRMQAERLASQRLARATCVLAAVTVALVVATVVLAVATFQL